MVIARPVHSRTGCHVGAHVGWGKSSNHHTMTSSSGGSGGGTTASGRVSSSGALFGGQVGCNYQFAGNWVLGVQGDIAGTDFNGMASDAWAQKFRVFRYHEFCGRQDRLACERDRPVGLQLRR